MIKKLKYVVICHICKEIKDPEWIVWSNKHAKCCVDCYSDVRKEELRKETANFPS